ncbi:MAG: hypothetical protein M0Z51_13825 [Propionibacterium sp.]|nr:hypothetical protein [Propionibacterium sp.]
MSSIRWVNLVIDVPTDYLPESTRFWSTVTRSTPTARPDGTDAVITLTPGSGSPWLRLSGVDAENPTVHLELVTDDPGTASTHARSLGARETGSSRGRRSMLSPAGVRFTLTDEGPEDAGVQDRNLDVLVDQACLDVPSALFEDEVAFWSEFTGWPVTSSRYPDFRALERPESIPVRVTFQRVGNPTAGVHPDLSCRRSMLTQREHEELGAVFDERRPRWSVMVAPSGLRYCVTDRDPATGLF